MNNFKGLIPKELLTPELLEVFRSEGLGDVATELEEEANDSPLQRALDEFITQYPETIKMKDDVKKLAFEDDTVLIVGETGTGKELIAKALHGNRKGAFIPINCGAIPENLIESELFGYMKGSFTGSIGEKRGCFEAAKNGTIFLDEIAELPIHIQATLLRVLQEKKIRKIGASDEVAISCRIIAATHRSLEDWLLLERFREDLYYRLTTFVIRISSIRSRKGDIPLIVKALDKENKIKNLEDFCGKIKDERLKGNVRSIQQMVRQYYVLGKMPDETN